MVKNKAAEEEGGGTQPETNYGVDNSVSDDNSQPETDYGTENTNEEIDGGEEMSGVSGGVLLPIALIAGGIYLATSK